MDSSAILRKALEALKADQGELTHEKVASVVRDAVEATRTATRPDWVEDVMFHDALNCIGHVMAKRRAA